MAKVLGLEHVTITTPVELEAEVVEWYGSCIGLPRLDKPSDGHGGAWFAAGEQQIHVMIDPHNPPKDAHFCFQVDDFEGFVAALRTAGCHIEQAPARSGTKRCFTRDPAGNSVEIVAVTEGS